MIYYRNLLPKSTILINADEACRPEGEARFGHLDLLFLWHPAEDHAQPWILHLVPALSTLLGWLGHVVKGHVQQPWDPRFFLAGHLRQHLAAGAFYGASWRSEARRERLAMGPGVLPSHGSEGSCKTHGQEEFPGFPF